MRADAAKELVTLSYINYEGELRYEWLEVDLGETRNQHELRTQLDCPQNSQNFAFTPRGRVDQQVASTIVRMHSQALFGVNCLFLTAVYCTSI